jgi:retron-type reverse transcriptase
VAQEGREFVVDLDVEKFFDRANHDILMSRIARRIGDKRLLLIIRLFLQAGMMQQGVCVTREEGTPDHRRSTRVSLVQDKLRHAVLLVARGPLSPLLANLLLDDLDQLLESRGPSLLPTTGAAAQVNLSWIRLTILLRLWSMPTIATSTCDRWRRGSA